MKDYLVSKIKDLVYKLAPLSYSYALGAIAGATILFGIIRVLRFG